MTTRGSSLYSGALVHRRYTPKRHQLAYNVGNLFIDIDELATRCQNSWLFGYNRRKIFSINDRHHGEGKPLAPYVRGLMASTNAKRIFMFCYPAVFGKVFNPLTVYFGFDDQDKIASVVYEVSNTFGQRHSYVFAIDSGAQHSAQKQFYVSPFNAVEGDYRFSFEFNEDHLRLNIALFENNAMKLCARFSGKSKPLNDWSLARSLMSLAWQPVKVMTGIHYHALKLYIKGLKIMPRPNQPPTTISYEKVKP